MGTALTGELRMQQEKYCAAAGLRLLAPRPLTSWRAGAPYRNWDRSGQHLAPKLLITSLPLPSRTAPADFAFETSRTGGGTKL